MVSVLDSALNLKLHDTRRITPENPELRPSTQVNLDSAYHDETFVEASRRSLHLWLQPSGSRNIRLYSGCDSHQFTVILVEQVSLYSPVSTLQQITTRSVAHRG